MRGVSSAALDARQRGQVQPLGLVVRQTAKPIYVENGVFGDTLDVSTLSSSFLTFLAAFFAFLAAFRTSLLFLDIRCGPPIFVPAWTFGRASQGRTTFEEMDSKSRLEQGICPPWPSVRCA
jgi:hypothetical protein